MGFWSVLKEDTRIFSGKQPGGIAKFFYFPDIRVVFIYRLSVLLYASPFTRPLSYFLTNLNDFMHGVWIGPRVQAGIGLSLGHPRGIVINPSVKIGRYVTMINQVTLGGPDVTIGDFVEIGVGAKVISTKNRPVVVGEHSIIGAGAVVTRSVPPYSVVAGVPARVLSSKDLDTWLEDHEYYRSVIQDKR